MVCCEKNRVIYYKDELSDEFSSAQIKPISIDENYIYDRKTKGKILHTFWYKIIARPLAYIFLKIKFGHKIINKEVLKGYSDKEYSYMEITLMLQLMHLFQAW